MAGERLTSAVVTADGIEGDRLAMVVRGNRVVTSRTLPALLGTAQLSREAMPGFRYMFIGVTNT